MLAVKIRVKLRYPGGVYNTKRITLNIRLYIKITHSYALWIVVRNLSM